MTKQKFITSTITTPLGPMVAIADEHSLYFLSFADDTKSATKIKALLRKANTQLIEGTNACLEQIKQELAAYFSGSLTSFKTPLCFTGSDFQQKTWQQLATVPYGTTQSYAALAHTIKQPLAYRAVARANSTNQHVIIIPCHRIINANGALGGYNAGLDRKKWLLNHEAQKAS